VGTDDALEAEFADDCYARAADVDVLTGGAERGGALEDRDVRELGGGRIGGEEEEGC